MVPQKTFSPEDIKKQTMAPGINPSSTLPFMWIRPLLSLIAVICPAETRLAKEVAANTKIVADIKKS